MGPNPMLALSRDSPLISAMETAIKSQLDSRFDLLNARLDALQSLCERALNLPPSSEKPAFVPIPPSSTSTVLPRPTAPPVVALGGAPNITMGISAGSPLLLAVEGAVKSAVGESVYGMESRLSVVIEKSMSGSSTKNTTPSRSLPSHATQQGSGYSSYPSSPPLSTTSTTSSASTILDGTAIDQISRSIESRIASAMEEALNIVANASSSSSTAMDLSEVVAEAVEKRVVAVLERHGGDVRGHGGGGGGGIGQQDLDLISQTVEDRVGEGMDEAVRVLSSLATSMASRASVNGGPPTQMVTGVLMDENMFEQIVIGLEDRITTVIQDVSSLHPSTSARSLPDADTFDRLLSAMERRIAAALQEALAALPPPSSAPAADRDMLAGLEKRIGEAMQKSMMMAESWSTDFSRRQPDRDILASIDQRIAEAMKKAMEMAEAWASASSRTMPAGDPLESLDRRIAEAMQKAMGMAEAWASESSRTTLNRDPFESLDQRIAEAMKKAMGMAEVWAAENEPTSRALLPASSVHNNDVAEAVRDVSRMLENRIVEGLDQAMKQIHRSGAGTTSVVIASLDDESVARIAGVIEAMMGGGAVSVSRSGGARGPTDGAAFEQMCERLEGRIIGALDEVMGAVMSRGPENNDQTNRIAFVVEERVTQALANHRGGAMPVDPDTLIRGLEGRIAMALEEAMAVVSSRGGGVTDRPNDVGGFDDVRIAEKMSAILERRIGVALDEAMAVVTSRGGGFDEVRVAETMSAILERRIGGALDEALAVVTSRNSGGGGGFDEVRVAETMSAILERRIGGALDEAMAVVSSRRGAGEGEVEIVVANAERRIAIAMEEAIAMSARSGGINVSGGAPPAIDNVGIAEMVAMALEERIGMALDEAIRAGARGGANGVAGRVDEGGYDVICRRIETRIAEALHEALGTANTSSSAMVAPQATTTSNDITVLEDRIGRSAFLSIENATRHLETRILSAVEMALSRAAMDSVASITDIIPHDAVVSLDDSADVATLFSVIAARMTALETLLTRLPASGPPSLPSKEEIYDDEQDEDDTEFSRRMEAVEARLDALPGLFKASLHTALDSHSDVMSAVVKMAIFESSKLGMASPEESVAPNKRSSILAAFGVGGAPVAASASQSRRPSQSARKFDDDEEDVPRVNTSYSRNGSVSGPSGGGAGVPRGGFVVAGGQQVTSPSQHIYRDPRNHPQVLYDDNDDDFAPPKPNSKKSGRGWWG
ncbi:hypothetical protein HDU67_006360 [Dinochytrium kinnereticum]|nr:hypothetical protein HDU67_006360 [Dinochytrium kinnereticum]